METRSGSATKACCAYGIVSIDWRDAEHSAAMRVGGLARHTIDRPFSLIDWDARREEATGVGLVTGPMLLEDTIAALDASARGEGPFVDTGPRKHLEGD